MPANIPAHRGITSELYGGGPELRLKQELLLGIGGWRLLAALGIKPEVCHLNEGHAAFAVLERARTFMAGDRAALRSRPGRHAGREPLHHPHGGGRRLRPLRSGPDRAVPRRLCRAEARHHAPRSAGPGPPEPGRRVRELQHGLPGHSRQRGGQRREPPARGGEPAASSSRSFRAGRRTRCRSDTSPTASTCRPGTRPPADDLWTEACGKERWLGTTEHAGAGHSPRLRRQALAASAPPPRTSLVEYARERLSRQLAASGASPEAVEAAKHAVRSQGADPRLRAPFRDLQAAEPAAARSRRGCCAS